MFFGDRINLPLPPADQEKVSLWAIKTTLTADLQRDKREVPSWAYADLFKDQDHPSRNSVVWTAAFAGRDQVGAHAVTIPIAVMDMRFSEHGVRRGLSRVAGVLTTLSILRTVFQVLIYERDKFPAGCSLDPSAGVGPVRRIWPVLSDTLDWPPDGMALKDDDALLRFAHRDHRLIALPDA